MKFLCREYAFPCVTVHACRGLGDSLTERGKSLSLQGTAVDE